MRVSNIALQNIRRRKTRALLLVLGFVISVAAVVFLYTTSQAMQEDVANKLDQYGSNILILPDTGEALTYDGITVEAPQQVQQLNMSIIPRMKTIKNKETLATIAPELLADTKINRQRVLLVGVNFAQELRLKKWWQVTGLPKHTIPDSQQILLGSEAASVLGIKQGQLVNIKGKNLQVAGIIAPTGSAVDDQTIFMDLSVLQKLTGKPGAISLVEAAAFCWSCPINQVTQQLREKLPGTKVMAVRSSIQSRNDTVNKFNLFALIVSVVLVFTSVLIVGLTMMSSIKERTKEIGVLRAIGFRKEHISQIILTETGLLSVLGAAIGYVLGIGLAGDLGSTLAQIQIKISWQPVLILYSIGAALLVGLAAGAYPAWRASRLDPAESLRYL